MNKLDIYLNEELYADWKPEQILTIGFRIDGKELVDWAFASDLLPPNLDLLGEPHFDLFSDCGTVLLICRCREIGCHPLVAKITLSDLTVTWNDFSDPPMETLFPSLGPFVFDRIEYMNSIRKLCPDWDPQ